MNSWDGANPIKHRQRVINCTVETSFVRFPYYREETRTLRIDSSIKGNF